MTVMEGSPLFNPETKARNHTKAGIEPGLFSVR